MSEKRRGSWATRTVIAAMGTVAAGLGGSPRVQAVEVPTEVHRYVVPAALPGEEQSGVCTTASVASAFRGDALRCLVAGAVHDPCFATARAGVALCEADPRKATSGLLVKASPAAPGVIDGPEGLSWAWLLELPDGSICRPVVGARRAIEGETEIYFCKFVSPDDADVVLLGELDDRAPVWTLKKAVLNKKFTPQTIKSLTVAAVKAVWQ